MAKNLVTRTRLAHMAGVTQAAITKMCKGPLAPACDGKKVDISHQTVVDYLDRRNSRPSSTGGIDPRYTEAIQVCAAANRYSATYIQKSLGISFDRAKKILVVMDAAGFVPKEDYTPPAPPKPEPPPARKPRGPNVRTKPVEVGNPIAVPEDIESFADMTLRELIGRFGTEYAFIEWLKATKHIEDINAKRIANAEKSGELVHRELVQKGVIEPVNAAHLKLLSDGSKTIANRVTALNKSGATVEEIEKFVSDQISSFIVPMKKKIGRILKDAP